MTDARLYIEAAARLRTARKAIALTGAGASVESGIPDFRSPGGLWTKYPPEEYATIEAFQADPDKVWGLWYDLGQMLLGVQPNPGHEALAEMEALGRLQAVITQNIDNLHQQAGNETVIEYHGNAQRFVCTHCRRRTPLEVEGLRPEVCPRCDACNTGAVLKPDVVLFGEAIPTKALFDGEVWAHTADVVIVVGTSAQVFPAAGIPYTAKEHGAYIIECNIEPTEFTHHITDAFLQGPCGQTLPRLLAALQAA